MHENKSDATGAAVDMSEIPVEETDDLSLGQDDSALDEQPSKRQRLEEDDEPQDEDEAVLALAADGLPGPDDHYGSSG